MNGNVRRFGFLAALLGTVAMTGAAAARFPFQPESRLWVEGTSTVRGFTCKATKLRGSVDPAPGQTSLSVAELRKTVRGAEVTVAAAGLDCGNATMNDHMRKALKTAEHATIEFQLGTFEVAPTGAGEGTVKLNGQLRLAGQERQITIEAVTVKEENGGLRVKGTEEVVMTDFGIKPPSLMMGTLKVGPKVKVGFDVVLRP